MCTARYVQQSKIWEAADKQKHLAKKIDGDAVNSAYDELKF
jgi:hypothetical protein